MAIRMTSCLRIVSIAVFSVVLFSFSSTVLFAAGGPSAEVNYFDLYTQVLRAVDSGKLDSSIGKKAHFLNSELQKEIIAKDTRLETLKVDAVKLEGSERDALLDELIAAGAEKERIYSDYRQRLAQLVDLDKQGAAPVTSAPLSQATDSKSVKKGGSSEESPSESGSRNVKFTSIPEDVTTGEFD